MVAGMGVAVPMGAAVALLLEMHWDWESVTQCNWELKWQ